MITEDYVSFETAKLLKEKGFDWEVHRSYLVNDNCFAPADVNDLPYRKDAIRIPTLQMAMKWLRKVHHLTIDVFHFRDWKVNIKTIPDDYFKADYSYPELKPTETYEQACEAAIKYCLENLII